MPTRNIVDLQLPLTPDGVPDDFIPIFTQVFNALRNLQQAIGDLSGANFSDVNYLLENALLTSQTFLVGNMQIVRVTSSLAIVKGQMVNIFDSGGGVMQARLADASVPAKRCTGIAFNTTTAAAKPQLVMINSGYSNAFGGLAPGTTYYLSTVTPGGIVTPAPAVVGTIAQEVGFAISSTELLFRAGSVKFN